MDITPEQWEICLNALQQMADDPAAIAGHERVKALIAKIHREGKKGTRQTIRRQDRAEDRQRQAGAALVQAASAQAPCPDALAERAAPCPDAIAEAAAPRPDALAEAAPQRLNRPIRCYICKTFFTELHWFYHLLCPTCAAQNYARRQQRANLTGRTALLTGGRLKIGYQTALRLLRDGASVLVTTRFPCDAAQRFANEADFADWNGRLRIYGLDLRHVPAVEAFADYLLATEPALDILIHNAAQTIKRPPEFYAAQWLLERRPDLLSTAARAIILPPQVPVPQIPEDISARMAQISDGFSERNVQISEDVSERMAQISAPQGAGFLPETLDADGQPPDLRAVNSWTLGLAEVSALEMLEVQLVNVVAPFLLNGRLKPLLLRSGFPRRFIINVSAMEGQFSRANKTEFHPHTNMAKAALNMMTRTSAQAYARQGIYMNSVDTGWITEENPHPKKTRLQEERGFYPPLDLVDGAARIYDPIARGINGGDEPLYGHFLKDYSPHPW